MRMISTTKQFSNCMQKRTRQDLPLFYDEYKIGDDNDEVWGPFLEDPKKTRLLF